MWVLALRRRQHADLMGGVCATVPMTLVEAGALTCPSCFAETRGRAAAEAVQRSRPPLVESIEPVDRVVLPGERIKFRCQITNNSRATVVVVRNALYWDVREQIVKWRAEAGTICPMGRAGPGPQTRRPEREDYITLHPGHFWGWSCGKFHGP